VQTIGFDAIRTLTGDGIAAVSLDIFARRASGIARAPVSSPNDS
jgi:hypothetical protein